MSTQIAQFYFDTIIYGKPINILNQNKQEKNGYLYLLGILYRVSNIIFFENNDKRESNTNKDFGNIFTFSISC